jgi:hypothetical protein
MMRSKSGPKFIPSDDMTSRLHGMVLVPPYAGSAAKLLGYEKSLVLGSAWCRQQCKLRLYSMEPGVGIEGLVCFMEQWGLGAEKVLIISRGVFITTSGLVMKLAHLSRH